jgi:ribonuclease HIII
MPAKTSYTYKLTADQQDALATLLKEGNYPLVEVPHTRIAAKLDHCNINLYKSGKLLLQGKNSAEFIEFTLEPMILGEATLGYEETVNPEAHTPHMGIDESGKGDFFGPMVIAAAYVDETLAEQMKALDVKDSKCISSDKKALFIGGELRKLLGHRFSVVKVGPIAYNRLYLKMRSVNRLLAWGHARALEDLLVKVPDCPRAISDQFGTKEVVQRALMKLGRGIELEQRHKAEDDLAVAAASIIAREQFLLALAQMKLDYGVEIPKGASAQVRAAAEGIVRSRGPQVLLQTCKCHFRTADQVLAACGNSRADLGPDGAATSQPYKR